MAWFSTGQDEARSVDPAGEIASLREQQSAAQLELHEQEAMIDMLREERDTWSAAHADLSDRNEQLEEERDRACAQVRKLRDQLAGITGRFNEFVVQELPAERAAEKLLRLLDAGLGFPKESDSIELHDIYMAMDDLREAIGSDTPRTREAWFHHVLDCEEYDPEDQEKECLCDDESIAPEASTRSSA